MSTLGQKRILYVQYGNPAAYPPLEHSARILAGAGWDVLFLGVGAFGADQLELAPHPRVRFERLPFVAGGWRQKVHFARYCALVVERALRWRPSWIYASDLLAAPVAALLSLDPRLGVLYHEHDSPSGSGSAFVRMLLRARRLLAARADLCVLPNQARCDAFAAQTGRIAMPVWNCAAREDALGENVAAGTDFWVLYHGSIVPTRLPPTIIDALALLPARVKLRIVGYETIGHLGYAAELVERARGLGIASRIEVVGPVPRREELLAWCRRSHVGLALMPPDSSDANERTMCGASNKPFDYLSCAIPFLVSELREWRETFVDRGVALDCDPQDPASLAAAIARLMDEPLRREMGVRGRALVLREWNYETQFAPVLACLESFVDGESASQS